MLRFHLDENVDHALADALRRRGIDASLPASVGLRGAADEEHIAFALREGRVVITHDADFLRLAAQGVPHAGIVFCHCGGRTIGEMLRKLWLLSECYGPGEMTGRIEYL